MHQRTIRILWTVFAILISGSSFAQDKSPDDLFHDMAEAHSEFAFGAAYAFGQDEPTIFTAGQTTRNGSQAVASDAPWHIGSITKTFTAALTMRLVDKGKLNLDTPIEMYLKRFKDSMHPDWRGTTLRDLLSHTSGLPANAPHGISANDDLFEERRNVLSSMWGEPLKRKRGTFHYSNIGFVLVGVVLEEVSGETWENLIKQEIGVPLGLSSLGFGAPTPQDAARGHQSIFGLRRAIQPDSPMSDNPKWMGPAGTVHLNMADLVKWGQAQIKACAGDFSEYRSQSSCRSMHVIVSDSYGLGWVMFL